VQQCHDLPGHELFQYVNETGVTHTVDSADVNQYLKEIGGEDFTAKEFRTWSGTVLMARELAACGASDSETEAKRNVVTAVKAVAQKLGNKPATCRAYYVHPYVISSYLDGNLPILATLSDAADSGDALSAEELCVLQLISESQSRSRRRAA
jgi:DNA topoisomerase-1